MVVATRGKREGGTVGKRLSLAEFHAAPIVPSPESGGSGRDGVLVMHFTSAKTRAPPPVSMARATFRNPTPIPKPSRHG